VSSIVVPTAREFRVRLFLPCAGGRLLIGEPSIGGEIPTGFWRVAGVPVLPRVRTVRIESPDLADRWIRCAVSGRCSCAPHGGEEQRHRTCGSTKEHGTTTDTSWLRLCRKGHVRGERTAGRSGATCALESLCTVLPTQPRTCTRHATTPLGARIAAGLGPRHSVLHTAQKESTAHVTSVSGSGAMALNETGRPLPSTGQSAHVICLPMIRASSA
jgi:hypothetical protein